MMAMRYGIARGLFSNEAGSGSAPCAAAAAESNQPVKLGLTQALGVFIDTIVICSCTAMIMLLTPESLTVHTLAIKRSSRLHLENAPLPDGETASRMVQLGLDTTHQLGMKPYYLYRQKYMAGNQENVGYALPGHACQYNVDIMEETTHILALGAGGISKRVYPEEGHIGRAPNVSNIEQYIARVEEMIGRKKALFLPEMPL